jgi:alkanesulfonate monooxygenase SsuD/methylene tetrahydromethanopterin reductase-like flavin-dependent oxidoreductase (luciferase family)
VTRRRCASSRGCRRSSVARTHAQARELADEIAGFTSPEAGFPLMTSIFGGLDLSEYELDAPFPAGVRDRLPANAPRSRAELFIRMAGEEHLTLRQVMQRIASSSGHRVVVGTPDEIADDMIAWFDEHAADGFNILPTDLPEGLRDFVEEVVPRLQRRGVFRTEYADGGLRRTLGIGATQGVA